MPSLAGEVDGRGRDGGECVRDRGYPSQTFANFSSIPRYTPCIFRGSQL